MAAPCIPPAFSWRGIQWFGWIFIAGAMVLVLSLWLGNRFGPARPTASLMMGFFFGALHLGLRVYLYVTERKNPVA